MGYQALLFCPDEKLARVVTQVFTELDFSVEPVNEPFGAVKKLMAQRYDAIVVDCENEQNATLLFKSARNSSSNQSSLALALVEGQAGVAKAYRIGANLVLTKPINVEQAKGTLRVARGLLRKNADAATTNTNQTARPAVSPVASVPAKPAPAAPVVSAKVPEFRSAKPPARVKPAYALPEFEAPLPAMAASAQVEESLPSEPVVPEVQADLSAEAVTPAEVQPPASLSPPSKRAPAPVKTTQVQKPASISTGSQGAAAAPAPAKESLAPAKEAPARAPAPVKRDLPEFEPVEASVPQPHSGPEPAAPTFSVFDEAEASAGSGGKNKIIAIAAVMLVAVGLAYLASGKFGKSGPASQPQSVAPSPVTTQPAAPSPSALSAAATSEAEPASSQPSAAPSTGQMSKPPAGASSTTAARIPAPAMPEIVIKNVEPPPIRVKTESRNSRTQAQEDSSSAAPNPMTLAAGSSNDKNLKGLVPSEANMPRIAGTVKISQGVSQGLLIKRIQPTYPQNALSMRIQGTVELEATINKEGNITNLKKISGDPVLSRSALDAVKQWRYKPYYLDGQPVDIQTQISVKFRLPE